VERGWQTRVARNVVRASTANGFAAGLAEFFAWRRFGGRASAETKERSVGKRNEENERQLLLGINKALRCECREVRT